MADPNERIAVERYRAPAGFEGMIAKHWGDQYAEKGEAIVEVWITHVNGSGSVTGFDIITTPKREPE